MDKETRSRIQRATQSARVLLEREYGEQLEGVYDIRMDGTIGAEPGNHLDAEQRVLRTKLVAAVEHKRAAGNRPAEAVVQYLRELAFTMLNRVVALKMLESRGLVQECVSRGDHSAGFKEFTGLAPGLVQLPDHGYRLYIESLFDEIGREVRVLFDRRDPASLLWPRRQTLFDLLIILNSTELVPVWGEDETIGWVYQYFNSDEERRQMRAESQAPRNSRELAARNQFFTPRYVVQFLTDNTLGRIWYEMHQGGTKLRDLGYMVRRPSEVFLAEGEKAPKQDENTDENLSQEELLRKTVYVAFRVKKDPRDLKVLDPACGSGHFLLYAFDLLELIYEEAWSDLESPNSDITGQTIREDFKTLDELRQEAPRLIVEHNLHGIDIDPRAVQITAFAFWMRAQKAWKVLGLKADVRPRITRSNVVTAEPMPGEEDLRRDFTTGLKPRVLGQIVDEVFEKMKLAGEAGSLLKIEDEIKEAVAEACKQWREGPQPEQQFSFFPGMVDPRPKQQKQRFDVGEIANNRFWEQAEDRILDALKRYAEQAESSRTGRRRLFAEDAARGFAFIDLCHKRYDVVLMNPPFGHCSDPVTEYLKPNFPMSYYDIYTSFVNRMVDILKPYGRVGCITSKTFFANSRLFKFRQWMLLSAGLQHCADLGQGVLDNATVETAAYILAPGCNSHTIDFYNAKSKDRNSLLSLLVTNDNSDSFKIERDVIASFPNCSFSTYWGSASLLSIFRNFPKLDPTYAETAAGQMTGDDFRFVKLRWEIPVIDDSKWCVFAKGGDFFRYYCDWPLLVEWDTAALVEYRKQTVRSVLISKRSKDFEELTALVWNRVNEIGFNVRALPHGAKFADKAPAIFPKCDPMVLLGVLCTRLVDRLCALQNPNRMFEVRDVSALPIPLVSTDEIKSAVKEIVATKRDWLMRSEPSALYAFFGYQLEMGTSFSALFRFTQKQAINDLSRLQTRQNEVDSLVESAANLSRADQDLLRQVLGEAPPENILGEFGSDLTGCNPVFWTTTLLSYAVGCVFGRWDVRIALDTSLTPKLPDPFDPLPACPPGMLVGPDGLPAEPNHIVSEEWLRARPNANMLPPESSVNTRTISDNEYPLRVSWSGILVDDEGHDEDIVGRIHHFLEIMWKENADEIGHETCDILGIKTLRDYFRKSGSGSFVDDHIRRYSKSRRNAPIYWQLSTPTTSYSIWLYYHRFTRDTMYRVLNDFVAPKLKHEERKLTNLVENAEPSTSASQRKGLDSQERFVAELRAFHEEVARISPLWNPNLNDGVIINFAPLWRLVPQHKPWQKQCKACWDELVAGDYDWAHLAMHLWPERVVPKCMTDRSLAIAHDLEEMFWEEDADGKWKPKKVPEDAVNRLIVERTSPSVKAALKSLLEAPAPSADRGGCRRSASSRRATTTGGEVRQAIPASADGSGETAIDRVREVIAGAADGVSKADVVAATGIIDGQWSAAINALLSQGLVTKTGERRGARYHIANDSHGEDSNNATE